MTQLEWIKDLILAEQKMEETGVVDLRTTDKNVILKDHTLGFLRTIKSHFVEAATAFNQLKSSQAGTVKIYGISGTEADFMLFRNGFKLIFSMRKPGEIEIHYSLIGSHFLQSPQAVEAPTQDKDVLRAEWGAFEALKWSYRGHPLELDHLVRHYFSRFIQESAK